MSYSELSVEERATIQIGRAQGFSLRKIACLITRSPSTISRELRRNRDVCGGYSARMAQPLSDRATCRQRRQARARRQGRRGKASYLKLGELSFEAVKFALSDPAGRVAIEPPKHQASHIRSIRFDGGILDGQVLHFSPELNTLIGLRGSGKSSILEAVRYALDQRRHRRLRRHDRAGHPGPDQGDPQRAAERRVDRRPDDHHRGDDRRAAEEGSGRRP